MVPSSIPRTTIDSPLAGASWVTVAAATKPKTMIAKYSAGPNSSAHCTISGASE